MTITHWQHQSDAREKLLNGFKDDFHTKTGNTIDFQSIPYDSYFQKLGAALEAGNGPCVFQLPANIVGEYQARGDLAPVPESVLSAADIAKDFIPASTALLKIGGEYYGLPTDFQTFLLFYNDDLFREAGLDPTKDFATWDEFRQAAVKLTKTNGDQLVQAGIDIAASPYQWYYSAPTLAFPNGLVDKATGTVTYDNATGDQVWKRMTDLITQDHVDSAKFLTGQSKFALGKAGMILREYTFTGVYKISAPDVKYSVHIAPPVADKTYAPVASTSWSYVVSKKCATPEQAWQWVSFLTSEDSERTWAAGGGELPSRVSLAQDPTLRKDPNVVVGLDSMSKAMPYNSLGWDDVFAIQQQIWDEITLGGVDVRTAVDKGAKGEDALYKKKGLAG
ncbi:sugar ABC transporter substrate-binding protein [Nakamurella endophytica]|uniref:Sugar ABC transporter substrate-binding protein n=1 Tax=Nakamurella endophytica TaxID=1748367 RepID=A0A917SVE0_9ACTN|nr:sugar ABC transporter substrate-binding protein [Nakamurella endophytica]